MIANIAVCCSGNTCRSPVFSIWLEDYFAKNYPNKMIKIWNAGIRIEAENEPVVDEAINCAGKMNLSKPLIEKLMVNKSKSLWGCNLEFDILFWITDPDKIDTIDKDKNPNNTTTRKEQLLKFCNANNSLLYIIPEKDDAHEAKKAKKDEKEVSELYFGQAMRLKEWSIHVGKYLLR